MPSLRIHHGVPSYDEWKRAFDSDPVDREGGGVRRYEIQRPVADPNFVMIDLDFATVEAAESFLQRLRQLWEGPAKNIMQNPTAWVVETVETTDVTDD